MGVIKMFNRKNVKENYKTIKLRIRNDDKTIIKTVIN